MCGARARIERALPRTDCASRIASPRLLSALKFAGIQAFIRTYQRLESTYQWRFKTNAEVGWMAESYLFGPPPLLF